MEKKEIEKIISLYPRQVYSLLHTSAQGLSEDEAKKRKEQYGENIIKKEKKVPLYKVFLSNFISPLAILLWVAGTISLVSSFIGEYDPNKSIGVLIDPSMLYLSIAIYLVNIINGVFSFIFQFKAGKMTDSLAKMLPSYSRVIRDGEEKRINSEDLVPGDILILAEGDRISADARILMCDDLTCTQSALDGEATPARKNLAPITEKLDSIVGAKNLVFAGTSVSTGSARCVVISTGMNTEFGKIASLTQDIKRKKSPLDEEISHVTKTISFIAFTVGIITFVLGIVINGLKGSFTDPSLYLTQFVFALGMIVAFIPEGLSPIVTLSLAKAVQRIAKEGALVKSLISVETLGSATVICSDKTGTLTKNEMTVKSIYLSTGVMSVSGNGYSSDGFIADKNGHKQDGTSNPTLKVLLTIGALCNDARLLPPDEKSANPHYVVLGDPTEACLLVSAEKGLVAAGNQLNLTPRIRELNFDSVRKMMTTIHQLEMAYNGAQRIAYTKGAPKEVIEKCSFILDGGKVRPIEMEDIKKAMKANDDYAKNGLRVLGMAYRFLGKDDNLPVALSDYTPELIEQNMVFVGLQAMQDPPREGIKAAIEECHQAGIKVIMITGDYGLTALAIAKSIGIATSDNITVITGGELSEMSDEDLKEKLKGEVIFARMAPEQKYRIVSCLQELGEVVAVTGDGVNDAPALKKADIGVAMGITGTDVAKDAADMIITDDNFTSIVSAIKEGRMVYANIKKSMKYIINSNIPEAIPFLLPLLSYGFVPQLLSIMEVLLIDLGTDLLPALALGQEKPTADIMKQKPRDRSEHIINKKFMGNVFIYGLCTTILSLAVYFLFTLFTCLERNMPFTLFFPSDNLEMNRLWMSSTMVVLTSIVFCQIGLGMNCRTERESIFKIGLFSNKMMNYSIIFEIALILLVGFCPWVNEEIFEGYGIYSWQTFLVIICLPVIVIVLDEFRKFILRKHDKRKLERGQR